MTTPEPSTSRRAIAGHALREAHLLLRYPSLGSTEDASSLLELARHALDPQVPIQLETVRRSKLHPTALEELGLTVRASGDSNESTQD